MEVLAALQERGGVALAARAANLRAFADLVAAAAASRTPPDLRAAPREVLATGGAACALAAALLLPGPRRALLATCDTVVASILLLLLIAALLSLPLGAPRYVPNAGVRLHAHVRRQTCSSGRGVARAAPLRAPHNRSRVSGAAARQPAPRLLRAPPHFSLHPAPPRFLSAPARHALCLLAWPAVPGGVAGGVLPYRGQAAAPHPPAGVTAAGRAWHRISQLQNWALTKQCLPLPASIGICRAGHHTAPPCCLMTGAAGAWVSCCRPSALNCAGQPPITQYFNIGECPPQPMARPHWTYTGRVST
jgi:hypothetical protein